jgi:hypothetical protein
MSTDILIPDMTRTCQDDPFTSAALVGALDTAWAAIRARHPEVPAAVIVVGSGSSSSKNAELKWGHFASLRWQHGDARLPEVLVSGEGLRRTPPEVFTTLLHEATHALADVRGIKDTSRQGRYHNKRFATLAAELGLTATEDSKLGWSPCTLQPTTTGHYGPVLDHLGTAMRAFRHPEEVVVKTRTNNNNGVALTCDCPRKIRVSTTVAEEGPIVCGVCDTAFLSYTQREEGEDPMAAHRLYDPTGEHHDGIPTYPYRLAPEGLATRRQLRTAGLQPARQPIAAQILWRKGKRVAYLYRVDLARPKRPVTPAQLAALDKANTALRTCTTCRQVKDYIISRHHGECLDCAPTALVGAR